MKDVSVSLDHKQLKWLDAYSMVNKMSRSEAVRIAVDQFQKAERIKENERIRKAHTDII